MATNKWKYPVTKRDESVEDNFHGTVVKDPYRWLENPDSVETQEWVKQQNELNDAVLSECTTRDVFFQEFKKVINFPRYTAPYKRGDYYYFYKNDGLQNQDVLYYQKSLNDEPEVFMDPNKFSTDGTTALTGTAYTDSGKYCGYRVAIAGSDWNTAYIKNTATKEVLADKLEWLKFTSLSWTHDEKGFFYGRYPVPKSLSKGEGEKEEKSKGTETDSALNQAIYYHIMGTPQSEDKLVLNIPEEPSWLIGNAVTDDGKYLLITPMNSCEKVNQVWYVDLTNPKYDSEGKYVPVKAINNFDAYYQYVANNDNMFWFFYSSKSCPKGKLIKLDLTNAEKGSTDVVPESSTDVLDDVTCVNDFMVMQYMHDVKDILQIYSMDGKFIKTLDHPIGSITHISAKRNEKEFFFKIASFLSPGLIYHYDLETDKLKLFREIKLEGYDASHMESIQVFYPSKDGTKIPMFINYKKGMQLNGENPVLLYGYGGFNISIGPSFSTSRILWMKHFNGIYAVANIRGGNEYGEDWHKGGILDQKQNVFDDFQYAAKYLIEQKYTSANRIAINGGSNGGLLVSTCLNQAPELFACGVSVVPVTDMLRFHKFTIGHAWCSDYGCADKEEDFKYLIKYSPLHNVKKINKPYPATYILTADHDDRVVPAHSYKLISELQYQLGNDPNQVNPLAIRIEVKAGHGAGKPLEKQLKETADWIAFIARYTGAQWVD